MARNITFTADETLIDDAREAARAENTTLNEKFRQWLEGIARERQAQRAMETIEKVRRYASSDGHKYTRDEMNARR